MSKMEELIPIGIDLGSLHARVAIGNIGHHNLPSEGLIDTRPLPNIISNAQGSRFTLALVGIDKTHAEDEAAGSEERHIFGDAARRALARDKKPTISKDPSSMVRELVRSSSMPENRNDVDEKSRNAAAFFQHLSELACDASSSHPSKLRTVVSVPVASTPEEQAGIVQSVERGVKEALNARMSDADGAKSNKKKKNLEEEDIVVVGVISDPAAVCIAHGLTEVDNTGVTDLTNASASDKPFAWKNVLVIDWGASGLTATHISRTSSNSALLSIVRSATEAACSGHAIVETLVSHCASMFERKNRVSGVLESVKAHHRLEMACESAVRTLSRAPTTTVAVDGLYEGLDMSVPISRPRFDMMVNWILRKAEALLQTFIVEGEEFDAVLVAGNVCDMPAATTLRSKLFPNASAGRGDIPADEAVAIGCARHAAAILSCDTHSKSISKSDERGPTSRDVTLCPLTIGVCIVGNGNENGALEGIISKDAVPLIEVGEPLPANVTRTFNIGELTSSSIGLVQMSGGNTEVANKLIGKIEGVEADSKSIEVTVELTAEGSLTVSVNGGESCKLC
jgi:molecular chaperone DnaK (HSP70)